MSGVNIRNLEKILDKWLLFQRFVTSIAAPTLLCQRNVNTKYFKTQKPYSASRGFFPA